MVRNLVDGIVLEEATPLLIAEAVLKIESNPSIEERFSRSALERAEYFSWAKAAEKLENFYRRQIV